MSTKYQMYLRQNGKFRFPVLPEKVSYATKSLNDNIEVAEKGEITIIQADGAKVVEISSFFPNHYFSGANTTSIKKANKYVQRIEQIRKSGKPARFTYTGSLKISMYATIESFEPYDQGGDVGTIYYSLKMKEYRKPSVRKITINTTASSATVEATDGRTDNTAAPQTYTVVSGDCLYNIAKRFYGDGAKYTTIYDANKDVIGGNPNLIYAGQVLSIPAA